MRKILFVFEKLQVNGASLSLLALLKEIASRYDVSLFLFSHEGSFIDKIPSDVTLLPEIATYKSFATQMKIAVWESVKDRRWRDAIFRMKVWLARGFHRSFSYWNDLPAIPGKWGCACSYADGLMSQMVVRKVSADRKVLWIHENYEDNPKPPEVLNSFYEADAIVGASKDALIHLRNLLGEQISRKMFVVHNITDINAVRNQAKSQKVFLSNARYNIVSVGRISYEKGLDLVPAILRLLRQQCVDVHWHILGGGVRSYRESVLEDAERQGVLGCIHFLGEKENPHQWTLAADCFVQLSRNEGWCMTISEALALGVPVVCNELPVFHEQIIEGVNGLFAHDEVSFANAIKAVLLGNVHLSTDLERFPCSPKRVVAEFDKVIESIC